MRFIDADALLEAIDGITKDLYGWQVRNIKNLITNAPTVQQSEPFGYFKAEPFGWTDCAETDEGAIALYEAHTVQREGWVSVPIEPTEEMIIALKSALKEWKNDEECYKAMIQAAPKE